MLSIHIENMIKVKRLRSAWHLSRMKETRKPHQILFSELERGRKTPKEAENQMDSKRSQ